MENKFLSQARKEILLKSMRKKFCYIASYCMGVFKLPTSLLREINRIIKDFWWNKLQSEGKIHWVSWSQMGNAKSVGGLGFRDLESFNMA